MWDGKKKNNSSNVGDIGGLKDCYQYHFNSQRNVLKLEQ